MGIEMVWSKFLKNGMVLLVYKAVCLHVKPFAGLDPGNARRI